MQLAIPILAALLNTSVLALPPAAMYSHDNSSGPCPDFAKTALCYESSFFGLVFTGCNPPSANVTLAPDLQALCVTRGKVAKCCPETYVCDGMVDGQTDGRMDGWADGWMGGWDLFLTTTITAVFKETCC